jgi:hypothetical protein
MIFVKNERNSFVVCIQYAFLNCQAKMGAAIRPIQPFLKISPVRFP